MRKGKGLLRGQRIVLVSKHTQTERKEAARKLPDQSAARALVSDAKTNWEKNIQMILTAGQWCTSSTTGSVFRSERFSSHWRVNHSPVHICPDHSLLCIVCVQTISAACHIHTSRFL